MTELKTVSEVTKQLGVSTRMLRYYEQRGLLNSLKKEDYAYRVYDEGAVRRLQQIIILRKLQIPLKQISEILINPQIDTIMNIFAQSIAELDDEIIALSTIRSIIKRLVDELLIQSSSAINIASIGNDSLLDLIRSLPLTKNHFKEEKSVDELARANETLSRLTDADVRIIYLPPSTVAASHCYGEEGDAEGAAAEIMDNFVRSSGLCNIKRDLRQYGFNHPNTSKDNPSHGYERWVTIPDDMEVPVPLEKKYFEGGLYAAYMILCGDFHKWRWLRDWVNNNPKYEADWNHYNGMHRCFEEHLNYVNYVNFPAGEQFDLQLDLLVPIRVK